MLPVVIPKEELERKYHAERNSLREIARYYKHDLKTILKIFRQHGIRRRDSIEAWRVRNEQLLRRVTQEQLDELYVARNLTLDQIERITGVARHTLRRYLVIFGIRPRTASEAVRGRRKSEAHRQKLRYNALHRVFPRYDTSIERKVSSEMDRRAIVYEKQHVIEHVCRADFAIPSLRIAIFCDGNYWHTLPKSIKKDAWVNQRLYKLGWLVLRFWENDINADTRNVVDTIQHEIERRKTSNGCTSPQMEKTPAC